MKITDMLCVRLQTKSLDILNALDCVSITKVLLADLRENGWESLLEEVNSFCLKHEIDIPDFNRKYAPFPNSVLKIMLHIYYLVKLVLMYIIIRYVDVTKSRNKHDNTTTLHHYKMDVFNVAIDQQLTELDDRFSLQATELLSLCASLDPRRDTFDRSRICTLVEKLYPADFSSQERAQLECQLPHFQLDTCNHQELKMLPSLAALAHGLVKTGKSSMYPMVDRLLRLVITLPVSTATAERAFSAMKLVKNRLRSTMGDDFLRHCMIIYIKKDIASKFSSDEIIDTFDLLGCRKGNFKLIEM